jgi:hypothetical protein
MPSDLIDRKLTHVVGLCDQNGDGVLEVADFETWVGRMAAIRGWEPGSDGHAGLDRLYLDTIRTLHEVYGDNGRVTVARLAEVLRSMSESGGSDFQAWGDGFFGLLDADGDGRIGPDEYRDFLAALLVDAPAADQAFAKLDLDGDGYISGEEFTQLYLEFFASEDPDAPGNWFWGPFE